MIVCICISTTFHSTQYVSTYVLHDSTHVRRYIHNIKQNIVVGTYKSSVVIISHFLLFHYTHVSVSLRRRPIGPIQVLCRYIQEKIKILRGREGKSFGRRGSHLGRAARSECHSDTLAMYALDPESKIENAIFKYIDEYCLQV